MLLCGFWFPDFFSFEPAEPINCNPKWGSPLSQLIVGPSFVFNDGLSLHQSENSLKSYIPYHPCMVYLPTFG